MKTSLSHNYTVCDQYGLPKHIAAIHPHQIDRAYDLSENFSDQVSDKIYANVLGLEGFKNCLNRWVGELELSEDNCSINNIKELQALDAICNLYIDEYRICLIVVPRLFDRDISIPRHVLEIPKYTAHFYVLVEVSTEGFIETEDAHDGNAQVLVHGFWRYDKLNQQLSSGLSKDLDNWTYPVDISSCDRDLDHLWLSLRTLPLHLLLVPEMPEVETLSQRDFNIWKRRFQEIRDKEMMLWQALKWHEAQDIFNYPELLHEWCEPEQTPPPPGINWQLPFSFSQLFNASLQSRKAYAQFRDTDLDITRRVAYAIQRTGLQIPEKAEVREGKFKLSEETFKIVVFTWISSVSEELSSNPATEKYSFVGAVFTESEMLLAPELSLSISESHDGSFSEVTPKKDEYYLIGRGTGDSPSTFSITVTLGADTRSIDPFNLR